MTLPRTWARALLGAASLLSALGLAAAAQSERHTLAGDRVAIYNLAGTLRVQPGAGTQVIVDVTRGGAQASQLKVSADEVHGAQALRVIYPSDRIVYGPMRSNGRTQIRVNRDGTFGSDGDDGWFGRDRVEIRSSGSGLDAHADLVVSVPKGQRLAIHWGVGDATVTNVDGDIKVSVAAATVTAEHTRGRLEMDTGAGAVTVTDAQGDVVLDTGSGSVTINGVRGDRLDLDSGSGRTRADNVEVRSFSADVGSGGLTAARLKATRIGVDVGSGGLDLDVASVVEELTIDAGSGGVTVRLPAAQGADIEIETGSGGIESDFAVQTTHLERGELRGTIGDGRGRIRIESGSGRVRLIKA